MAVAVVAMDALWSVVSLRRQPAVSTCRHAHSGQPDPAVRLRAAFKVGVRTEWSCSNSGAPVYWAVSGRKLGLFASICLATTDDLVDNLSDRCGGVDDNTVVRDVCFRLM